MTNKSNNSKNFFDAVLDAQTQTMDTMMDSAKKFTNGNSILNENLEKGAEFFKKGLNTTKETLNNLTAQTQKVQEESTKANGKMADYFQTWKDQQTVMSNQMKEWNTQLMNHWMNPSNSQQYFQQMPNNWMNMFNQQPSWEGMMNPTQWQENATKAGEQMKSFWSQLQHAITSNYNEFAKNIENGTAQESFKGMINMTEGFSKFYEMWMPMLKSMNDKNFNMDSFKNMLNMDQYKTFMDKYFSFVPQTNTEYMNNMKTMFMDGFRQNNQTMSEMMGNAKSSWNNMFPMMNNNPFMNLMNSYNQFNSQMNSAVSPFMKLMTPTNDTKTMEEWSHIINNLNIYNIKSSELQYMVYETGMKVMESIAENLMHKVENGEEANSMMKLYQEWLNLSDAQYVKLFETDSYSQLMAEVSSLQLGIKKDVELQMEKAFVNIPVVTRSEINEVYQALYDLKKELRATQQSAKTNSTTASSTTQEETTVEETVAPKATAKKPEAKKTAKRK